MKDADFGLAVVDLMEAITRLQVPTIAKLFMVLRYATERQSVEYTEQDIKRFDFVAGLVKRPLTEVEKFTLYRLVRTTESRMLIDALQGSIKSWNPQQRRMMSDVVKALAGVHNGLH
jgi:hypothetical protein